MAHPLTANRVLRTGSIESMSWASLLTPSDRGRRHGGQVNAMFQDPYPQACSLIALFRFQMMELCDRDGRALIGHNCAPEHEIMCIGLYIIQRNIQRGALVFILRLSNHQTGWPHQLVRACDSARLYAEPTCWQKKCKPWEKGGKSWIGGVGNNWMFGNLVNLSSIRSTRKPLRVLMKRLVGLLSPSHLPRMPLRRVGL